MLFCTRNLPVAFRLLATIVLFYFFASPLAAQDGCMQMGMNVGGLSYWGSDHAFKDAFKYSGTFRTEWAPGFAGTGDAPRVHLVPLDAEGYPFEMPYTVPGRGPVIVQAPVLLHSDGKFPRGIYSLFWEGVGTIDFWGAAIVPGSYVQGTQGGRALVEVLPTSPGMFLRILRSQRGNHIRNVRLVRPGFENDYQEQPFNPEFLERVRPFYSIRYMGWMRANTNDVVAWADRTTPRSQTQSRDEGASYEYIIQLSNLTQTHPWINVPYAADDDHVRRMAKLFYDSLAPELNVYVEYANEFWNFAPGFLTFGYLNSKYPGQVSRGYALEISRVFRIFREAFGADSLRVRRILACQHANPDIARQVIRNLPGGAAEFDYISPAAYVNFSARLADAQALGDLLGAADVNNLTADTWRNDLNGRTTSMKRHFEIARALGKEIVLYEGGQHYVDADLGPEGNNSIAQNRALYFAKFHPSLVPLYQSLYDSLNSWGAHLNMGFTLVGGSRPPTTGGNRQGSGGGNGWGTLANIFDPPNPDGRWEFPGPSDEDFYNNGNRPQYQVAIDYAHTKTSCFPPVESDTIAAGNLIGFNGRNSYAEAADAYKVRENADYTVELWASPALANQEQTLLAYGNAHGSNSRLWADPQGRLRWNLADDNGLPLAALQGPALVLGQWHHIAAVRRGAAYLLYVNGTLVAQQAAPSVATQPTRLLLGATPAPDRTQHHFRGQLDEIRVWATALPLGQAIQPWMCRKVHPDHPQYAQLKTYFTCDTVGVSLLWDRMGNHATLHHFSTQPGALATYSTSSAPIGDVSAFVYPPQWQGAALSMNGPGADQFAVHQVGGATPPDGLHIYLVRQPPLHREAPRHYTRLADQHWFGVFLANGTNTTYDVAYQPQGHPGAATPAEHRLLKRAHNADPKWLHTGAQTDRPTGRLNLNCRESYRAEYMLGVRPQTAVERPGPGTALSFDGNNLVDIFPYELSGDFTISCWMKRGPEGNALWNLSSQTQRFGHFMSMSVGGSGILTFRSGNISLRPLNSFAVRPDEWVHVAVVKSGRMVQFYLNGTTNDGLNDGTGATWTGMKRLYPEDFENMTFDRLTIGQAEYASPLTGQIDEFSVFTRALTQEEIRDWMCRKITPEHPAFCQYLKTYLRFDEGAGQVLEDRFGPYDAELRGGPQWVRSGAALGDRSAHSYQPAGNTALEFMPPVSLAHPDGDRVTANLTQNRFTQFNTVRRRVTGMHVYLVEAGPDAVALPDGIQAYDSTRYWGVYPAMPYAPGDDLTGSYAFRAVYEYQNNRTVNLPLAHTLRLLHRPNNSQVAWSDDPAILPDTDAHTLTADSRRVRDEYLLAATDPAALQPDRSPPAQPVLSGPATVCLGSQGLKYFVDADPRASSYLWELPNGMTGFSQTDTLLASAIAIPGGAVRVWAVNENGRSLPAELLVTVAPSPYGSVEFTEGPFSVCQEGQGTFTIPPVPEATAYHWAVSAGAALLSGQGTGTAVVQFGATGGKVSVWVALPTCGTEPLLLNERTVQVLRNPRADLTIVGNTYCLSGADSGRVQVLAAEPGIVYQTFIGTPAQLVGPALTGTGQTLTLPIPRALLVPGTHRVGVLATAPGCAPVELTQRATVTVLPPIREDLEVIGEPVCGRNRTFITIRNSQPNVRYTAKIYYFLPDGRFSLFEASDATEGNGADLQLPIRDGWFLRPGTVHRFALFAEQPGCPGVRLAQETTITVYDPLNLGLAVQGSAVCAGADGAVWLPETQPGVAYRVFIGTNPASEIVIGQQGEGIWLTIPAAMLPDGQPVQVRVQATIPGALCSPPDGFLAQTVTLTSGDFLPDQSLAVEGMTGCRGTPVAVTVRGTQSGVWYQPFMGAQPVGERLLSTGGNLDLLLHADLLAEGNNTITVKAQGNGCSLSADLTQTATVRIPHFPRLLEMRGETTVCSGTPLEIFTRMSRSLPEDERGLQNWFDVSLVGVEGQVSGIILGRRGSRDDRPTFTETLTGNGVVHLMLIARNNFTRCTGDTTLLSIRIVGPPEQPAPFTHAPAQVCRGESDVLYAVPFEPNMTYTWTYTGTGVIFTPSPAGNEVLLSFSATATSGTLEVITSNACGPDSSPRSVAVEINDNTLDLTLPVTGSEVCAGLPATVSVGQTEPGVLYQIYKEAEPLGPAQMGNGGTLNFSVPTIGLAPGPHELTVKARGGGCFAIALANRAIVEVEGQPDGLELTWTGLVDENWHEPGNWSCHVVPGPEISAYIPPNPEGNRFPQIFAGAASAFHLRIGQGASLVVVGQHALTISGHFRNQGTFTPAQGTVRLNGAAPQQLAGKMQFFTLEIENLSGTVTCTDQEEKSVTGLLRFRRGVLLIGRSDWHVGGSIEGAGPGRYIVTNGMFNGGGFVSMAVPTGGTPVVFPVGLLGSYTPATLANTGQTANFRVRVFPGVYMFGLSGNERNARTLRRTWEIEPFGPNADRVNVALRLHWNATDPDAGFWAQGARIIQHRGTPGQDWMPLISQLPTGNGPFSMLTEGITQFSKFTLESDLNLPLPVAWLVFTATEEGPHALLRWETNREEQISGFVVEKRQAHPVNGATASFDSIGFVPAGARRYAFYDREFTRSAYYRLRVVGAEAIRSRVLLLEKSGQPEAWGFQLYPNPVVGNEQVELVATAGQTSDVLSVEVISPSGQRLGTFSGSAGAVNQWLNALNSRLPSGMYLLRLAESNRQAVLRWVKQ